MYADHCLVVVLATSHWHRGGWCRGWKKGLGYCSATMAAILPAILVGGLLFAFAAIMTGIAVLGPIAAMIGVVLALGLVVPLLLDALIASIFA